MSEGAALSKPPVLETSGLTKVYGHVEALKAIDFAIAPGEVVGLVGDNGAGKSTLVACLSGATAPSAGSIAVDGERVAFGTPREAQERGVQTVYQDLSLASHLTPSENVFLGREPRRAGVLGFLGWIDRAHMRARTAAVLDELSSTAVALDRPCSDLSGGQRQAVAIARALMWERRLIILDEPTAALGVAQTQMVLDMVRRLRESGTPVILISHNMHDVFAVTTRIVVLRLGAIVLDVPTHEAGHDGVVGAITGASTMSTPTVAR